MFSFFFSFIKNSFRENVEGWIDNSVIVSVQKRNTFIYNKSTENLKD